MVIFITFVALKILKLLNHHKVDMKKIILVVAIAGLAISCQKIQTGGNKGVLKLEHGVERYNDDMMSDEASAKVQQMQDAKAMTVSDSTKVSTQPAVMVQKDSVQEMKAVEAPVSTEKK